MVEGRARRAAAKNINYAKEQEFSDDDIFEDSPGEDAPAPTKKSGRGRPRKSRGGGDDADEDDYAAGSSNKPVYVERGYDTNMAPIRERFPFMPEYEADGSPRIDLIVGRRPIDEKESSDIEGEDDESGDAEEMGDDDAQDDEEEEEEETTRGRRSRASRKKKQDKPASPSKQKLPHKAKGGLVEYEYLLKYRGRSYLHLEWKSGADLESMGKSGKTIYRRYVKKVEQGNDDELEDPNFDPSYAVPQKIVDQKEQEMTVELTDKELLAWEKRREKELAQQKREQPPSEDDEPEKMDVEDGDNTKSVGDEGSGEDEKGDADDNEDEDESDWKDEEIDFHTLTADRLRKILSKEEPYYPVVPGCDNPYRDGYVTEPPKKPRASYLFFQCTMRSYFQKRNPDASQAELMTILGETWRTLTEEEQQPFAELAKDEAKQFERERTMLEKAQRPNAMWQPLRRCLMVLNRLAEDSFADIFLEPVDQEEFPDYEEIIDTPMDLATIRQKLSTKKYQAPEQFARDMRKVWNNCKIYNQHGSAIWHVADYMSKQFERLYHAWVLEFRERYLRWAHPRARPWEHTCRAHDGKCGTPDDKMVLCDHCDAMYGFKCCDPPLKKAPKGVWHCPECKPKLSSVRGVRMLSAIAEHAAKKRAELGDTPKRTVKQTMYLVKWAGLGYEHCTWETKEDIGNPALISEFHRLNNAYPDEPDMPEDVVEKFLASTAHVNLENAGGKHCIPDLRVQLYAQTRAFQFAKFGMDVPDLVCTQCGPKTQALSSSLVDSPEHPRDVVECLGEVVYHTACDPKAHVMCVSRNLPPLMVGEYDTVVPITANGLMMNVGDVNGSVAFLGYRKFADGSSGPAERNRVVHNVGDKIIAVDGVSTADKTFKEVIGLLKESGKKKFAVMRFLGSKYDSAVDLTSVGKSGNYAIEVLQQKFSGDRKKILLKRRHEEGAEEAEEVNEAEESDDASADAESDDESEGSFEPDSDDDEIVVDHGEGNAKESEKPSEDAKGSAPSGGKAEGGGESTSGTLEETTEDADAVLIRQETTQSLAQRLLAIDVGYSSDEGGEEHCAFFLDGTDNTFTTKHEVEEDVGLVEATTVPKRKSKDDEKDTQVASLPVRRADFSSLGDRSKLVAAVSLSMSRPSPEDFDRFPGLSTQALEEQKKKEAEEQNKVDGINDTSGTVAQTDSPAKVGKKSTVKIEQVSIETNEAIHVWPNPETAAATLQLNLPTLRQILSGEYDEDIGEELGGFKWRFADVGAIVTAGNRDSKKKKGRDAWLEFKDKLYDPNDPHIYKNGNRLRDYQVEGVNWLASTFYRKHGCILADEMGLGKTVQIVSYIEHLYRVEKIRRPYLVVVPLSTVEHWRREFEGWTDMICCIYHDRQRVWRDVLREYEWYFEDRPHTPEFLKFDVLVTTYDTLIGDFDVISPIPFRVAVVDEAHRLRNQKGKLLECMKEISAKGTLTYGFQSRVLISGTPLQNDLTELWTLLNFIEPIMFPDLDQFHAQFGNMANRAQVEALQQKISPYMLRRVKEDVAKDIPAKEETVIDVELTNIQKQYYRAIFEHNHAFLNMGATRLNAPKLMNIQMELRKVCNHPCLLDGVEHREHEKQYREFMESGLFENKTPEEQQQMLNEHIYVNSSGKMVLLDKLLPKLRQEGHKVLIFSQMVKMLDFISEYCEFRNFPFERLDGRVRGTDRQKAIDRFERESDSFLFLLSTRAGGVGINLTAADICIIFDSDWNPQNDIQAQARCHRIGQTKDVRIYRLITSRSFEQEMFDRASKKLGLEQAVLGTFGQDEDDDKPTNKEMEQLLKKGAYALLEDDNDDITKEFCADDIENILAKRTRTRVVEGTKTASWLNKQGMVVSKTKFSAENKSDELDMDDPLFWQKVMPDFVTPSIMQQKLHDLSDEILGVTKKKSGRGQWRRQRAEAKAAAERKQREEEEKAKEASNVTEDGGIAEDVGDETNGDDNDKKDVDESTDKNSEEATAEDAGEDNDQNDDDNDGSDGDEKKKKFELSRQQRRKIAKYVADLKSMMEGIFDEDDDEGLPNEEKEICQKLLLTISVKEKLFNEEQRHFARVMLKRLEGSRRRRCRTSDMANTPRRSLDEPRSEIREELLITSSKKPKRKRRTKAEMEAARMAEQGSEEPEVGEDGYKVHSDDEADWSDVVDDDIIYKDSRKKATISKKEAARRRQWAADDDAATAAGRQWPAFPRHVVQDVLTTVLDEVLKQDEKRGGIFSVPVPKEDFPEYYEQIQKPMDYGTMKAKLENGEYRSVQAMQKDFILVMQNCVKFNAADSDIVMEARRQALARPNILRKAALQHNLFMAEDGTVLEILDDDAKKKAKNDDGSSKKRRQRRGKVEDAENSEEPVGAVSKKKKSQKKKKKLESSTGTDGEDTEDAPLTSLKKKKKPRIRISLPGDDKNSANRGSKRKRKTEEEGDVDDDDGNMADVDDTPVPKKRSRRSNGKKSNPKQKKKSSSEDEASEAAWKVYLDPPGLKAEREMLDGSFPAARKNFTKRGPWVLPASLVDSFKELALSTLSRVEKHDRYSVFAEPVSDSEAPGYSEAIANPIDMSTMRGKVESGDYGDGNKAMKAFYHDFLTMFDNCNLYNEEEGEVVDEAARIFGLLPEVYAESVSALYTRSSS